MMPVSVFLFITYFVSAVMDNCALPKDMGPCPGAVLRWYYDTTEKICKQFMYGGCQGNGNRFRSEVECKNKCHISSQASFRGIHCVTVFCSSMGMTCCWYQNFCRNLQIILYKYLNLWFHLGVVHEMLFFYSHTIIRWLYRIIWSS